jgi:alpha 1,2-mannosyltransferase
LIIAFFPRQISLHFTLSFTHQEYGRATSISNIRSKFTSNPHEYVPDKYYVPSNFNASKPLNVRKANATMVMLARNGDMDNAVRSVRRIQDRFNSKFQYPWVFLNEEPFTDEFKQCVFLC